MSKNTTSRESNVVVVFVSGICLPFFLLPKENKGQALAAAQRYSEENKTEVPASLPPL